MPTFKLQIKTEEHMNYSAVSIAQRQKTSFRLFCFPPSSAASVRSPLVPTHHRQASHGPFLLQKPAKQEAKQQVGVAFNNEEIMGNSEAGVLQRPWKQVSPKKRRAIRNLRYYKNHDMQWWGKDLRGHGLSTVFHWLNVACIGEGEHDPSLFCHVPPLSERELKSRIDKYVCVYVWYVCIFQKRI